MHLLPLCRSRLILTCHNYAGKIYEPYFPSHPERDIYVSLLQQTDPPAHESLLKAALVRRAMTDVSRVLKLREDKPAAQNLLQKGSIGDDLWNSLLQAEKELEAEIMEVVAEANTFVEGWGGLIFQTAGEMIANEKIRSVYEETAASRLAKGACTRQFLNTTPFTPRFIYFRTKVWKSWNQNRPPSSPATLVWSTTARSPCSCGRARRSCSWSRPSSYS